MWFFMRYNNSIPLAKDRVVKKPSAGVLTVSGRAQKTLRVAAQSSPVKSFKKTSYPSQSKICLRFMEFHLKAYLKCCPNLRIRNQNEYAMSPYKPPFCRTSERNSLRVCN
jgi:hypothetical protein